LKSVSKYSVSNEIEVCGIIQPKYDGVPVTKQLFSLFDVEMTK